MQTTLNRLHIGILLTLLVASHGCHSNQAVQPESTPLAPSGDSEERPLTLWEVQREGHPPSWMFGTCHMGVTLQEALPESHQRLLKNAKIYVMEADISQVNPAEMAQLLMLKDGQRLDLLMGQDVWARLVQTLQLGPAAEAFKTMKPFGLLSYWTATTSQKITGLDPSRSMDMTLDQMAKGWNIETGYLETVQEQLGFMDRFPLTDQLQWLEEITLPGAQEKLETDLDAVLSLCRTGDPSEYFRVLAESDGKYGSDWERVLLDERNKAWIPKLEPVLDAGGAFVAVGAGHYFGDNGLLALLQAKGYSVKQLSGSTPASPSPEPTEDKSPEVSMSLSQFLGMVEEQLNSKDLLCKEEGVLVQCFLKKPQSCQARLKAALSSCAQTLKLPTRVSEKFLSDPANTGLFEDLGLCVPKELVSGLNKIDSPGCRKALGQSP